MKQKYEPYWRGVSQRQYISWWWDVFGAHYQEESRVLSHVETAEDCLKFFLGISKEKLFVKRFSTTKMWAEEQGMIVYKTITGRIIRYDQATQEITTEGMEESENFLQWCEEFFGSALYRPVTSKCPHSDGGKFGDLLREVAQCQQEEEAGDPTVEELEQFMVSRKAD